VTYLDDLLNSSSIMLFPSAVVASWPELEPGYNAAGGTGFASTESMSQIGQQIGPQGYAVTHSLDDGLPDPVTSTGNNEASGVFSMDLAGRPPAQASLVSLALNAGVTSGNGQGTLVTTTYPGDLAFWDYVFVAVTFQSDALVTEVSMPADTYWPWTKLGDISDGGFHTYVFGRKHYTTGVVPPQFRIDSGAIVHYSWVMGSVNVGRTPSSLVMVPVTPGDIQSKAETVTGTAHAQTPVTVNGRGWTIGAFAGPNVTWTSSGNTVIGQASSGIVSTALVASPMRQVPGSYNLSGTSSSSTGSVAMVHFALEVRDRIEMDAVSYFSTFNKESPVYGFERDTAKLQAALDYVALDGTGVHSTLIYTGQMAGIDVDGRTATVQGVSKTRLLLDDSHTLPTIYGFREGLTTDWLAGYLLAQGGQYIGVAPNQYTRWWAPMYGSAHPYMDGSSTYSVVAEYNTARPGAAFKRQGIDTTGPFATAMFAQQTNDSVITITGNTDRNWATEIPGVASPVLADIFSTKNSVGSVGFWLRADPWVTNPAAITTGNPDDLLLFTMNLWHNYLGANIPGIRININASGNFNVWCGSSGAVLNGSNITADGAWHFFGYKWDYANGTAVFRHNNITWGITGQTSVNDVLPSSDANMQAYGGYNAMSYTSHLPLADFQIQAGQPYTDDWPGQYPLFTPPVTYRSSRQPLTALANPTPLQGWSTLQSLNQSTLSQMRIDESDNAFLVTLDYFGETAQMTVDTLNVLDTDFNAAQPSAADDPSQTRNVVTVQYTDTRVDSQRSTILEMNTSLAVPIGTSYVTFPLDTPTAETHGAAAWWASTPEFQKLTALQIAGTNAIQNENVMSVNTLPDGSGTVWASTTFRGRIYDWDSSSITVQFINTSGQTLYLANNGTQIPFLRALGYAITMADGYVTVRDNGSIDARRERALTTQLDWVTDRTSATEAATMLVTLLSRPRPQLTVTVQGDPRRKPGTLCRLVDSTGLAADGTWRIYRIQHNYTGPQYTQDLVLLRVGELGNWDEGIWDDTVWGA
jgi:hypothetical protein